MATNKNILPPSFGTWYQFYLENKDLINIDNDIYQKSFNSHFTKDSDNQNLKWFGTMEGYEFDIDFIKARVFDEIKDCIVTYDDYQGSRHSESEMADKIYRLKYLEQGYPIK